MAGQRQRLFPKVRDTENEKPVVVRRRGTFPLFLRKVMHMRLAIISTALLLAATAGAQEPKSRPSFDNFPVKKIWKGKPAAPKLVPEDEQMFRTRIRYGAKFPVEFAGHYTVPRWGCGAGCSALVIVD